MPGEVDKLQVKIEASAKGALKNVDYLISKLGDLRKVSGITADSLHAVNVELRDMSNYLKGIKSVGDPFAGFSRGASKAAENARKVGDAMRRARKEAEPMQRMEIVPVKPGALKAVTEEMGGFVERVKDAVGAFNRFRAEWEAWRAVNGRAAIGGSTPLLEDSKIIDGMPWSEFREDSWRDTVESPKLIEMKENLEAVGQAVGEFKIRSNGLERALAKIALVALRVAPVFGKVLWGAFKKVSSAVFSLATAPFKALGNALTGMTRRLAGFLKSIVRIAMYRAIRSALRALTQGLSEGTENLYFFSQAVGSNFAPSMDRLATSMLYLKNGFAAMFSPLIEYFAPFIDSLVDKLVNAFNWVQKLFARLTGKTTWNKAVKVQTVYKESTDKTTKAVKKLRQEIQLMDFDELNNITDNTDDGSSSSTPETKTPEPSKMFVVEPTDVDPYDEGSFFANLKKWFEEEDPIGKLWEKVSGWWNGIDFTKVGENVGSFIRTAIEAVDWKGLWEAMKNIFEDLRQFLEGVARGLFPDYFAKKDAEKAAKEEAKRKKQESIESANKSYEEREATMASHTKYNEDPGESIPIPVLEFTDTDKVIQSLADERNLIDNDIVALEKTNRSLKDQLKDLFTDKDGNFNEDEMKTYEFMSKNLSGQEFLAQQLIDPKFAAYVNLQGEIEDNQKAINKLLKKRNKYEDIAIAIRKNELRGITSVDKALKSYGKNAEALFDSMSEDLPGNVALVAARAVSTFTEADWRDGGTLAMKKLNDAFIDANIPYSTRQIALKAAAKFGTDRGWTKQTANATEMISNALHNADIPMKYQKVAKNALNAYLTYTDWANGGKISASDIIEAFKEAGMPDDVAEEAGTVAASFLTGFDGQNIGAGAVDDVQTGMAAEWTKDKPTLTITAKVDTSKIPLDVNDYITKNSAKKPTLWKPLPIELQVAMTNTELARRVNAKVNALNASGTAVDDVMLELIIRQTAKELGIDINNLTANLKPNGIGINATVKANPSTLTSETNSKVALVKPNKIALQGEIKTTASGLQTTINGIIKKVKPDSLTIPVKFSGNGKVVQIDKSNPYSGFRMENYATGGFPAQGTMFVAGEMAGQAEMVGNINGRTGVASGQEITGIGDAVWSTGGTTARLIGELIEVVREKNLTISPSAALGRTVAKSQRMYATQTG